MFCFVNGSPKLVLNPVRVFDGVMWGIILSLCVSGFICFFPPINVLMS